MTRWRRARTARRSRRCRGCHRACRSGSSRLPRANVPTALVMAIVLPRASGTASLTIASDVTNPYSNPRRNRQQPDTPRRRHRRPTASRSGRRRASQAADACSPACRRGRRTPRVPCWPRVRSPRRSSRRRRGRRSRRRTDRSSQVPEMTNTESPPGPSATCRRSPARRGPACPDARVSPDGASSVAAASSAGSSSPTTTAAVTAPTAIATNGPRHPNLVIRIAINGAPTSSAIAHDVSNSPIARARHR